MIRRIPVRLPTEAEVVLKFQLTVDCQDPDRLSQFWAAALG